MEAIRNLDLKRFFMINIGLVILALGLYYFLIPSELAAGGVTGFAMVINHFIPTIPVGIFMILTNIILFILAFVIIGKDFGGYTIYTSLMLSFLIYIMEIITPLKEPIVDDILLNLVFGILIQGVGMALVFNYNTSTGGTDIVAKIINKFTHIEIGKSLFLADFLIVIGAAFAFGLELGMYALLGILINSAVIDKAIAGFNTRAKIAIISEKEEEITKFITGNLERGVTIYHGESGYSNEQKRIINTVVSRKEYIIIKHKVREIDPRAFIWVSFVTEVLGEGFTE